MENMAKLNIFEEYFGLDANPNLQTRMKYTIHTVYRKKKNPNYTALIFSLYNLSLFSMVKASSSAFCNFGLKIKYH